ncbi:hypothetical protein WA588_002574, partial [Blastocystis sp. NMH]
MDNLFSGTDGALGEEYEELEVNIETSGRDMESLLRDEVSVEHLKQSKEYSLSIFHTIDAVRLLFSFILQKQNCDEVSTYYISKVASEIAKELPDEIKDMVLADEALMNDILTLVDDEHFSPHNALCFFNIFTGLSEVSSPSCIDYLRSHSDILLVFYKHFSSLTMADLFTTLLLLQDENGSWIPDFTPVIHVLLDSLGVYTAADNVLFLLNRVFEPDALVNFESDLKGAFFISAFIHSPFLAETIARAVATLPTLTDGASRDDDLFVSHVFALLRRILTSRWQNERTVFEAEEYFQYLEQQYAAQPHYACDWSLVQPIAALLAAQLPALLAAVETLAEGETAKWCPPALAETFRLLQSWLTSPHVQENWPTSPAQLLRCEAALAHSVRKFAWSSLLHGVAKRFYRAVLEVKNAAWTEAIAAEGQVFRLAAECEDKRLPAYGALVNICLRCDKLTKKECGAKLLDGKAYQAMLDALPLAELKKPLRDIDLAKNPVIDPSSMNSIPMNVLLSLLSGNSLNELQQWMEANMDDDDI